MRLVLLLAVVFCAASSGRSARILAMLPFPAKSHYMYLSSIVRTLVQRGHHVVEYSPFPPKAPTTNYTHVGVNTDFEKNTRDFSFENFKKLASGTQYPLGMFYIWYLTFRVCEDTLKHASVQALLNSQEHFDLVLTESTFGQESMVVFGHKFHAPVVSLQSFGFVSTLNMIAGNTLSMASIPDMTSFAETDRMSFVQRLLNFLTTTTTLAAFYLFQLPRQDRLVRQYFREDIPPLAEMISNVSLHLVNTHPAIEYTQPYTPNIVPVAGINIPPERTPLPQELQQFMDEAEDGVIYFSLGTVVSAHLLPQDILGIFVNVFGSLKQRVLWKIEADSLLGLTANVKLVRWVNQPAVLGHRKCVLFMTHGGLFSQLETLDAGVPTVSIPFFGDQPYNVRLSEERGFGVKLSFTNLSEESLSTALHVVLMNPRYRENAQRLSGIFRDRPVSPADSVVFWTEYVLRHAGAHHLRPASTQLTWYQLTLLDVLATVLLSTGTLFFLIYVASRKLICRTKNVAPRNKKLN